MAKRYLKLAHSMASNENTFYAKCCNATYDQEKEAAIEKLREKE